MVRPAYTAVNRDQDSQINDATYRTMSFCLAAWTGRITPSYAGTRLSSSSTGMEGTCMSMFVAAAVARASAG